MGCEKQPLGEMAKSRLRLTGGVFPLRIGGAYTADYEDVRHARCRWR